MIDFSSLLTQSNDKTDDRIIISINYVEEELQYFTADFNHFCPAAYVYILFILCGTANLNHAASFLVFHLGIAGMI
jgi:hypothetical protein